MLDRIAALLRRRAPDAHELGRRGERRAALFYRLRLYRVIARNLRFPGAEIDLVVKRGTHVAFVEVKTRGAAHRGEPFEAVDRAKQLRIAAAAQRFVRAQQLNGCDVRFDVVSLVWSGARFELTHFPDAFQPIAEDGRPWRWR